MSRLILRTEYPCCGRKAYLSPIVLPGVVERTRHFCEDDDEVGTAWRIEITERRIPIPGAPADAERLTIHVIEWLDLGSREAPPALRRDPHPPPSPVLKG